MQLKNNAEKYFIEGRELRQRGDYEGACKLLRQGLALDPTYAIGWMNLGVMLKDLGNYKDSEQCLRNALETNRNYGDAWFNLGTLYLRKLGKYEDALRCLKEAMRCNPEDEEAVGFAAETLQRLGRMGEAGDLLDKAIAGHPNFHQMVQMRAGMAIAFRQYLENIAEAGEAAASNRRMTLPKYAKSIEVVRTTDQVFPFRFNYDAYVAVALNKHIPNSEAVAAAIVDGLQRCDILDKVVFESFEARCDTLHVELGRRVPVDILQVIVRACITNGLTSAAYSINEDDGRFGYTQRVYVGSLGKTGGVQLAPQDLENLLREEITQREFMRLIAPAMLVEALEPVYVVIMDVPPGTPQAVYVETLVELLQDGTVEAPYDTTHVQMVYMTLPAAGRAIGNKSVLDELSRKALERVLEDHPKFREYVQAGAQGYVLQGLKMTPVCATTSTGHNVVVVQFKLQP